MLERRKKESVNDRRVERRKHIIKNLSLFFFRSSLSLFSLKRKNGMFAVAALFSIARGCPLRRENSERKKHERHERLFPFEKTQSIKPSVFRRRRCSLDLLFSPLTPLLLLPSTCPKRAGVEKEAKERIRARNVCSPRTISCRPFRLLFRSLFSQPPLPLLPLLLLPINRTTPSSRPSGRGGWRNCHPEDLEERR